MGVRVHLRVVAVERGLVLLRQPSVDLVLLVPEFLLQLRVRVLPGGRSQRPRLELGVELALPGGDIVHHPVRFQHLAIGRPRLHQLRHVGVVAEELAFTIGIIVTRSGDRLLILELLLLEG